MEWRQVRQDLRVFPNLLSFLRLTAGTFFTVLFILLEWNIFALTAYVLGALSDALDGWLARKFNQITMLGEKLDPFADKVFYLTPIVVLAIIEGIPGYLPLAAGLACLICFDLILLFFGIKKFLLRTRGGANVFGKIKAVYTVLFFLMFFSSARLGWDFSEDALSVVAISAASFAFLSMAKHRKMEVSA